MKLDIVGLTIGILLNVLGVFQLVPALVDWHADHSNADAFLLGAFIAIFFGSMLVLVNWHEDRTIGFRQAFLLTTSSWFFMSLFAAVPLYLSDLDIRFVDAFFEAVSGISTTGSTVLVGLDDMSQGILLWRSMMQWIGGVGIVAFAIVFLPFLRIGGMQLFQTESSDRSEKVMPRSSAIIISLVLVYSALTVICAVAYRGLGMNAFDAINHAMTTISTGGFSTHDQSFGYFDDISLQLTATLFMLIGGIPFVIYVRLVFQGRMVFFDDDQVRTIVPLLSVFIAGLTIWLWTNSDYGFLDSFRYVAFNVVSVITTTGYATIDYTLWGPFAAAFFFFITYLGACAGSTSGGLKVMRLVIVAKSVGRQLNELLYPNGVFTQRYQGRRIGPRIEMIVLGFLGMYVLANVVLTLALTLLGLDFVTAISAAATSLANVGPGIGSTIGPAGNFASLPDPAKWLLCLGMLLGRLEILTVIVLFTFEYWQE